MNKLIQLLLLLGAIHIAAHENCVPAWRAKEIVTKFEGFFTNGNVHDIKNTLTSDFTLYSDSQEFTTKGITPVRPDQPSGFSVGKGKTNQPCNRFPDPHSSKVDKPSLPPIRLTQVHPMLLSPLTSSFRAQRLPSAGSLPEGLAVKSQSVASTR